MRSRRKEIFIIRIILFGTDDGGSAGFEHFIVFIGTLGYTKEISTTFGDTGTLATVAFEMFIVDVGFT
jgi:hypothetical protein